MVSNLVLLWILIVSLLETKASVASCPIPPSQPWEKRANHRQDRDPDMKTWPSKTSSLERRNLGSVLRDEYLMHAYPNFYCSADGRVIPVDPTTGLALVARRKRSLWNLFFPKEYIPQADGRMIERIGGCDEDKATWFKPNGWRDPIPMEQAKKSFPNLFNPVS